MRNHSKIDKAKIAQYVRLKPQLPQNHQSFDYRIEELVKEILINEIVSEGDDIATSNLKIKGNPITFVISKTIPKGSVKIVQKTNVVISHKYTNITSPKLSRKEIENRIKKLLSKNNSIIIGDIENLISQDLIKAFKLLNEKEINYDRYEELKNKLRKIEFHIQGLTGRIASGELSSSAFEKARDDLERKKKDIEEELWQLRNQLFREDYEKPF